MAYIRKGGGITISKKQKLQYRFHDPNCPETTAAYILPLLIEANKGKVEQALREAAENQEATDTAKNGRCTLV